MDTETVKAFMLEIKKSQPSLPAILLAEKAMDHFLFADDSDEAAECYDLAFRLCQGEL